jgi:hypothetical protein
MALVVRNSNEGQCWCLGPNWMKEVRDGED